MYILDYDRQISKAREMTVLKKDQDNFVMYYHHPTTNEMWKSFFPKMTANNRGPKLLRTEPVPSDLEERLFESVGSSRKENAIGLGIELSAQPDGWEQIMEILERTYLNYPAGQLKLFIKNLGILNPYHLLNELDKKPADYGLDKDQLKQLTKKAKRLKIKRSLFFWK